MTIAQSLHLHVICPVCPVPAPPCDLPRMPSPCTSLWSAQDAQSLHLLVIWPGHPVPALVADLPRMPSPCTSLWSAQDTPVPVLVADLPRTPLPSPFTCGWSAQDTIAQSLHLLVIYPGHLAHFLVANLPRIPLPGSPCSSGWSAQFLPLWLILPSPCTSLWLIYPWHHCPVPALPFGWSVQDAIAQALMPLWLICPGQHCPAVPALVADLPRTPLSSSPCPCGWSAQVPALVADLPRSMPLWLMLPSPCSGLWPTLNTSNNPDRQNLSASLSSNKPLLSGVLNKFE
jgi:hypothetical protein